jgi:dipeptidyl aminopeptidase/acylaminoacyl peptidase
VITVAIALAAAFVCASGNAELPPLVPRQVLFSPPEKYAPSVAPDGKRIAWLAPDDNQVLQIWVRTLRSEDAKQVTSEKKRPVLQYAWADDNRTILYVQDSDGDENFHLFAVDLPTGSVRDLTPWQGIHVEGFRTDRRVPHQVLVGMNLRDRRLIDMHRIDLRSGSAVLDTKNPGDVLNLVADAKMVVRAAVASTPDGGNEIRWRKSASSPWKVLVRTGPEEVVDLLDFSADGRSVYLRTSIGTDKVRLVEHQLTTGRERELLSDDEVDVDAAIINPVTHVVEAVPLEKATRVWKLPDAAFRADFEAMSKLGDGAVNLLSRDHADRTWIAEFMSDHGPLQYYAFDRASKQGTFLFVHRPKLVGLTLAPMKGVVIKARDGLELAGYLTLPPGVEPRNLPLILNPHGGPWQRDTWGYNREVQLLANRGYAVLQVNFRGSTGYGKRFLHAGDREWGRKMHDDLIDAVRWAVAEGIADPNRLAIYGGSYGGYSALAGAALTPDVFRCAVDSFGISNLTTFMKSIPPYWATFRSILRQRVGDHENPADGDFLKAASPLYSAEKIRIPLLIAQGANDVRVVPAESEQILAAIERNGGRATYVLYSDEGHGFARSENNIDFTARAEKFLAECLNGRSEPMEVDRYPGSTASVKEVGLKGQ